MFVNEFIKKAGGDFAETLPPEREDGQPEAKETDSFLVAAIRRTGIPITVTDYETGVESLKVKKYSDDQPRDEKGRFSSGPSTAAMNASETASSVESHQNAAHYHEGRSTDGSSTAIANSAHRMAADAHKEAAQEHQRAKNGPHIRQQDALTASKNAQNLSAWANSFDTAK